MKSTGILFVLAVLLFSCNVPKTDKEESISTSKVEALTALEDRDTVKAKAEGSENTNALTIKITKPLLIARGSEPGWYAEFFPDHLRLLIDNGTDSLIDENDFSDINNENTYENLMVQSGNDKKHKNFSLAIKIEDKECTEEGSGEKREKAISITYNKKTYKGCATAK